MTLAALTAALVFALRLGLHYSGRSPEGTEFMLVHFLALVTVVYFAGHRQLAADAGVPFPQLVREGFKSAALYALLTTAGVWLFYASIHTGYFEQHIDELVAQGVAQGQPEAVIRPRMQGFFTPFNYASITFFALLAAGGAIALATGALVHKVLRRLRR